MPATPMVPRGVRGPGRKAQASGLETPAGGQAGEQKFMRDKDAEDVERCALEHRGGDSPASESKGEKRGHEGEPTDEPAEKYLRVPPLPLGLDEDEVGHRRPTTPEVKLPITPRHEGQMIQKFMNPNRKLPDLHQRVAHQLVYILHNMLATSAGSMPTTCTIL